MERLYDLVLLIDSNAPDDRQREVVAEVESMLRSGGTIVSAHDWGTRRLSFEIDHRPEAAFHLYQFEGSAELLERLDHSLKIMDGVLRFRIIRQGPGAPPVPPSPEPLRVRREDSGEGRVAARAAADAPREPGDAEPGRAEPAEVSAE
jgi:small subunit ribosomal protein S6